MYHRHIRSDAKLSEVVSKLVVPAAGGVDAGAPQPARPRPVRPADPTTTVRRAARRAGQPRCLRRRVEPGARRPPALGLSARGHPSCGARAATRPRPARGTDRRLRVVLRGRRGRARRDDGELRSHRSRAHASGVRRPRAAARRTPDTRTTGVARRHRDVDGGARGLRRSHHGHGRPRVDRIVRNAQRSGAPAARRGVRRRPLRGAPARVAAGPGPVRPRRGVRARGGRARGRRGAGALGLPARAADAGGGRRPGLWLARIELPEE